MCHSCRREADTSSHVDTTGTQREVVVFGNKLKIESSCSGPFSKLASVPAEIVAIYKQKTGPLSKRSVGWASHLVNTHRPRAWLSTGDITTCDCVKDWGALRDQCSGFSYNLCNMVPQGSELYCLISCAPSSSAGVSVT